MKKFALITLCVLCIVCFAIAAVGCNIHTHAYTLQVATDVYKVSDATCTQKAKYYYSCECGEKGTGTFDYGELLPHTFDQQIVSDAYLATSATCLAHPTYFYSCKCGAKGTETFVYDDGTELQHIPGAPVYDFLHGANAYSAVVQKTIRCTVCGELISQENIEVSLPEATHSYDGQLHSLVPTGTDALPDVIRLWYYTMSQGQAVEYDITKGYLAAGDYPVFAIFVDKNGTPYKTDVVLTSAVHINKDGKYHEVTFCFDDLPTNNVSVAVKHGETIPAKLIPQIPSKEGYDGAWMYDGLPIVDDVSISILYTTQTYTITYVMDNAAKNNPRNPSTYTYESGTITLYAPQSSLGLTFQGWYTSPSFETKDRVSVINSGSSGNIVLYAKFLKYRIEAADGFTFDYDNYDYPALIQTVSSSRGSVTLSSTVQVSDGCTWTLSRDIEGEQIIKTKNMSLVEGHNIAYITVWYGEEYNVVYYLDIYRLGHRTYSYYSDGKVYRAETTVEEQTYLSAPEAPTKVGYTFEGWYANVLTDSISIGGITIPSLPAGTQTATFPYRLDNNVQFVAVFTPNVYTATFDVNGGKPIDNQTQNVTYDTEFTPVAPERDGYTFVGWADEDGYVFNSTVWQYPQSTTFTAQWQLDTYTLTYVFNDDDNTTFDVEFTVISDEIVFEEPFMDVYDFMGWYLEPDFINKVTSLPTGSFGDKFVYAKWTPTVYNIIYVLDGGTNDPFNPSTYTVETDDITFVEPTKVGYAFVGWFDHSDGGQQFTELPKGKYNGDVLLFARWQAVAYNISYNGAAPQYTVGFNLSGADGEVPAQTIGGGVGLAYPAIPTRSGYLFAGWYTTANCSGNPFDFAAEVKSDVTLYAKWIACTNTVLPYNGGISVALKSKSSSASASDYLAFVPLVSGSITVYTTGSNDTYGYLLSAPKSQLKTDDDSGEGNNFSITYNVTAGQLYYVRACGYSSSFTAVVHLTVAMPKEGGMAANDSGNITQGKYTIEDTVTLYTPSRIGYDFDGWYTEDTFDNKVTQIAVGSIGDKAFYAKWVVKTYNITYVLNGGANKGNNPDEYTIESDSITLAVPGDKHTFTGWYTDETLQHKVTEIAAGSHGDITLYAGWQHETSSDWVVDKQPTCTHEGLRHKVCSVCGGNYGQETIATVATAHVRGEEVTENVVEVTCQHDGSYDIVVRCTECNKVLETTHHTVAKVQHNIGVDNICSLCGLSCSDGLVYEMVGSAYKITGIGTCTDSNLVIPKYYQGVPVTYIDENAFRGCSSISTVTMFDNITSIGSYAFFTCSGLTSVTIPDSVTSIGDLAFEGCSGLTSITIPDSVTSIGSAAFSDCADLTSITIGNSVTSIGDQAFYNCSGLTSITIPDRVTSIGGGAFDNCSKLTRVTIPDSITKIGKDAFAGCQNLQYNEFGNAKYLGNAGNEYLVLVKARSTSITSCSIDDKCAIILENAFKGCDGLTEIHYNGDLTGWLNISGLGNLMRHGKSTKTLYIDGAKIEGDLVIPEGVKSIGSYAFV